MTFSTFSTLSLEASQSQTGWVQFIVGTQQSVWGIHKSYRFKISKRKKETEGDGFGCWFFFSMEGSFTSHLSPSQGRRQVFLRSQLLFPLALCSECVSVCVCISCSGTCRCDCVGRRNSCWAVASAGTSYHLKKEESIKAQIQNKNIGA